MCGYAFYFGQEVSYNAFSDAYMCSNIIERGGDGDNFIKVSDKCFMAHSLFHVTSIEPVLQPLALSGGFLLFNGEIYNFEELKRKFSLTDLDSDTILLGKLIEKIGVRETIELVYGAISITYYDVINNQIYLYRDSWGQKPLYYSLDRRNLMIASSFQFIDNMIGNQRSSNLQIIYELFGFSPFGYTLNPNIHSVPPGYLIVINCDSELELHHKTRVTQNYCLIDGNIEDVLCRRLKENVPESRSAIAVSGGVDSSILALLLVDLGNRIPLYNLDIHENKNENQNLHLLTEKLDELPRKIEVDKICLPNYASKNICDHPVENKGITSTAILADAAHKDGVRVMLTGMGADEYFGGYARAQAYESLRHIYVTKDAFQFILRSVSLDYRIRCLLFVIFIFTKVPQERIIFTFILLRHKRSRRKLLRNFLKFKYIIRKLKISLAELKLDADLFEQLVLFERHYVMPDFMCLPLDTIAQKFKIEMRSPFLNPEFDSYLNNNPSQIYKDNKILLRAILTKKLSYKFSKKERFQL